MRVVLLAILARTAVPSASIRSSFAGTSTIFNVVPVDQMFAVSSAVNRVSRNGVLIGGDERVRPYQALQAVTTIYRVGQ